jgi:diketogulonate reductase-like aldo/keto reductase
VARGSTVLAKSTNQQRIKSNLEIIELDKKDMDRLDEYSRQLEEEGELKRYVYPPFGVDFGFPDKARTT